MIKKNYRKRFDATTIARCIYTSPCGHGCETVISHTSRRIDECLANKVITFSQLFLKLCVFKKMYSTSFDDLVYPRNHIYNIIYMTFEKFFIIIITFTCQLFILSGRSIQLKEFWKQNIFLLLHFSKLDKYKLFSIFYKLDI